MYNGALEERIDCWRKTGRSISRIDQFRSLTVCRREILEMASDPVAIQRGTLRRLDEAYRAFFRRVKVGGAPGFPRFRGRRGWDSLSAVSGVNLEADPQRRGRARLRVPGFDWLAVSRRGGNPYPGGEPVGAVLKRAAGKWYAVVCLRVAVPEFLDDGTAVGVDMNAGQVAVSGVGRTGAVERLFHAPDASRLEGRAKRLSRKLACQRRGSRRRERTRLRLEKTRRRIACRRHDWRHGTSRAIAGMAHTAAVEDLRVQAMTASARLPGPAEVGAQPRHPGYRMGAVPLHARIQGRLRGGGGPAQHQPDLPCLRAHRRRVAQDPGPVRMHGLRPCRPCGRECSPQHTAPGTGASARGGSVAARPSGDP